VVDAFGSKLLDWAAKSPGSAHQSMIENDGDFEVPNRMMPGPRTQQPTRKTSDPIVSKLASAP
jgi:hypothetical protein